MTAPEILRATESAEVPEQVLRWARRPGAAAFLLDVREKVEFGKTGDRVQVVVPEAHRDDVGRLLGVAWDLSGKPVTLRLLREALFRDGVDLRTLLVAVGGPLRDRRSERQQAAAEKDQVRAETVEMLTAVGVPPLVAELAVLRRWLGTDPLTVAGVVASAWAMLPSPPHGSRAVTRMIGLAEFAGQELLNPHALDRDQPAGRATARLLAATFAYLDLVDYPASAKARTEASAGVTAAAEAAGSVLRARAWRTTWTRAGIACDQVSSTVLVLNVPLVGINASLATLTAVRGEPLWLTERMTTGGCSTPNGWGTTDTGARRVVRVCENPSVMEAAANRRGAACPPLVCI